MDDAIGVDIGASGVRIGRVELGQPGQSHRLVGEISRPEVTSVDEFVAAISAAGRARRIGLSVAGFVTSAGAVSFSRAQPWLQGPLQSTLAARLGGTVRVVHDGEAHLFAALTRIAKDRHPVVAIASGSSLAVAMTDERGRLRRPVSDANWEFGEVRINTSASEKEVWWALGRRGFDELVGLHGTSGAERRFGARLGGYAAELCGVFGSRTVVLSGGIVAAHGAAIRAAAQEEFSIRLPWWVDGELVTSPYGHDAGVIGAAASTVSPA